MMQAPPSLEATRSLAELFAFRVGHTPDSAAYQAYDNAALAWRSWSWRAIGQRVEGVTLALEALDLPAASRIAILLPNGLDAVSVDLAALALGHVPVPLHALDNPGSIAFILADCAAAVLVLQSAAQWHAIAGTGTGLAGLRHVLVAEAGADASSGSGARCAGLAQSVAAAASARPGARRAPDSTDAAALVYTSGTTGKPKGVVLTHHNVLQNVKATMARVAPRPDDLFLSFLPLSHTFERTAGYYLPMAAGSCVAHARSVALLADDLKQVRPTILVSVPRIYERSYLAINNGLSGAPLSRWLFGAAVAVGWRRFRRAQRLAMASLVPAWLDDLLWPVFDRLVARQVRAGFGGRLRAAVSGGAALPLLIARSFIGLGIPILQGYGMTETSPVVSANGIDDNDPETVGRALPGVAVRIGANQELQVRGPCVMRGYWGRDADTAAAMLDGWLRTGDQARIDQGRIRILGRIKELIVTSTGEKIAPADLEQAILGDPRFEQAYAFGDGRPFIACAVVLQRASWQRMAAELGLDPQAEASWTGPTVAAQVLARIAELTRDFPRYAQPRAVIVSLTPWTAENTLLTPTLKLKRLNLAQHFGAAIDQLYRPRQ